MGKMDFPLEIQAVKETLRLQKIPEEVIAVALAESLGSLLAEAQAISCVTQARLAAAMRSEAARLSIATPPDAVKPDFIEIDEAFLTIAHDVCESLIQEYLRTVRVGEKSLIGCAQAIIVAIDAMGLGWTDAESILELASMSQSIDEMMADDLDGSEPAIVFMN